MFSPTSTGPACVLRGVDLTEQPLHSGEVLLVVTCKVVREAAYGEAAVAFKASRAAELRGCEAGEQGDGAGACFADGGEGRCDIGVGIVAIVNERVAVDRGEQGIFFVEGTFKADMVAVELDVANVTDLLDCREGFTWDTFPGSGRPVPVSRWDSLKKLFEVQREDRE